MSSYPRSHLLLPIAGILIYAILIVYGSLFPLEGWRHPQAPLFDFLRNGLDEYYAASDLIVNLLAYIPLGFLLFVVLVRCLPGWASLLLAISGGCAFSLSMEALQGFLPIRVSSVTDWLVNTASTALGAFAAYVLLSSGWLGTGLDRTRRAWLRPGGLHMDAAFFFGLLGFTMLVGAVAPALGRGSEPLWLGWLDVSGLSALAWLKYVLTASGCLLLMGICLRSDKPVFPLLLGIAVFVMVLKFVMAVLFLKLSVTDLSVSLQALLGLSFSLLVVNVLLRHRAVAWLFAVGALVAAFLLHQLWPWTYAADHFRPINLMPFAAGHMRGGEGFLAVIDSALLFVMIGLLFAVLTPGRYVLRVAMLGGMCVAILAFGTEWLQQYMLGRYADITDAGLAVFGWCLAWVWPGSKRDKAVDDQLANLAPNTNGLSLQWLVVGLMCVLMLVFFAIKPGSTESVQVGIASQIQAPQPGVEVLPRLEFASFKFEHPRLPAPTPEDIALLRAHNPAYLSEMLSLANGGEGQLEAAITMAFIEPGSQNLERIFENTMNIRFHYRGNGTEVVVRAYDWLYHYWDEDQRAQLREHLFAGFDFTHAVIRDQRFSPYNVFWYNSPFQRLLAAGIVLYEEQGRGADAMQVAHDMLKLRMLPVWRQIMGENGGWHEGGEYVGIGIGQAVWRVPAMWRQATGEDLFVSESYLRGFLDFLIYRQRPDNTSFRWGDARYFVNGVPDGYALAAEYQHLAAMLPRPAPYRPSSWPWGPLIPPVSEVSAHAARAALPLSRIFDGIGMLVARSDWTPEATYLSFKAGDNFWSHSHLDQGAFTIYKGGALAIDSGLYGPGYGSDHHMNYSYQTIAHNTITVHDPADSLMLPKGGALRPIANDGGQRRVGSGWAEYGAPASLEEWKRLEDVYHTGRIVHSHEDENFAIVVSDITPAYTNQRSGRSNFHHRTRRVERAWRTLAYDRVADVVIVYDDVVSSRPEFRKRWLLHTMEEPVIGRDGFKVWVTPGTAEGKAGGRLEGHVLFPLNAHLLSIGGPGFEFFVEGINYNEQGEVNTIVAQDPRVEAGEWRIEVMPAEDSAQDNFLVVMFPRLIHEGVLHRVERLQEGGRIGVLIEGDNRIVRWWFTPGQLGLELKVSSDDGGLSEISLH